MKLDLGSGPHPAPGFTGIDICPEADFHVDLWNGKPWPFENGSVEALRASHVIEHIPHDRIVIGHQQAKIRRLTPGGTPEISHQLVPVTQDAFFWFFDEAYRVAAKGALFELAWPHPLHDHADQDPTHCRRLPISHLDYLSRAGRRLLAVHQYPVVCDWVIVSVTNCGTAESLALPEGAYGRYHELRAVLRKE